MEEGRAAEAPKAAPKAVAKPWTAPWMQTSAAQAPKAEVDAAPKTEEAAPPTAEQRLAHGKWVMQQPWAVAESSRLKAKAAKQEEEEATLKAAKRRKLQQTSKAAPHQKAREAALRMHEFEAKLRLKAAAAEAERVKKEARLKALREKVADIVQRGDARLAAIDREEEEASKKRFCNSFWSAEATKKAEEDAARLKAEGDADEAERLKKAAEDAAKAAEEAWQEAWKKGEAELADIHRRVAQHLAEGLLSPSMLEEGRALLRSQGVNVEEAILKAAEDAVRLKAEADDAERVTPAAEAEEEAEMTAAQMIDEYLLDEQ